ncbi:cytochrome b-c1 complex subunit 7 [Apis florea]|uniref:cytochrome b-c1 complex subunit 7 n=1 Tax=Apis florea TaxID=7463 RepID=UPI000252B760|nr:cytochrome b-c1 complex subunit 7 [Apis florea]
MATYLTNYLLRKFPNLQKWAYEAAGFNQYGLHRDDILHETEEVREALKRVPPHIVEERDFRIIRAMQLDCQKKILPKEQWTKFEDDILYLTPIIDEIRKEREEKERWNAE